MQIEAVRQIEAARKLLLLTCAAPETEAVRRCFYPEREPVLVRGGRQPYRFLGVHGEYHVFTVVTPDLGPQEAQSTVHLAFQELDPKLIIPLGIAFGIDDKAQRVGDVLVSKAVQGYDIGRLEPDGTLTPRQQQRVASRMLVQWFLDRQRYGRPESCSAPWPTLHIGTLLSGAKLIDNLSFRDSLLALWPNGIVGGEMEAVGVIAAAEADADKREWIIVKAICDFADGRKNNPGKEQHQAQAAWNAALVVKAVIDPQGMGGLGAFDASSPTPVSAAARTSNSGSPSPATSSASAAAVPSVPTQGPAPSSHTRCQLRLIGSTRAFATLKEDLPDRQRFETAWKQPLRDGSSVIAVLADLGPYKYLTRIVDAVHEAWPNTRRGAPSQVSVTFVDPAVTALAQDMMLVGLEQLLAQRTSRSEVATQAGRSVVPYMPEEVELAAVEALIGIDAGVHFGFDPDSGGYRVRNWIIDVPISEPGVLSPEQVWGAELHEHARRDGMIDGQTLADLVRTDYIDRGRVVSDEQISARVGSYTARYGARPVIAIDKDRQPALAADTQFHDKVKSAWSADVALLEAVGTDSLPQLQFQSDMRAYLEDILQVLHPRSDSGSGA